MLSSKASVDLDCNEAAADDKDSFDSGCAFKDYLLARKSSEKSDEELDLVGSLIAEKGSKSKNAKGRMMLFKGASEAYVQKTEAEVSRDFIKYAVQQSSMTVQRHCASSGIYNNKKKK